MARAALKIFFSNIFLVVLSLFWLLLSFFLPCACVCQCFLRGGVFLCRCFLCVCVLVLGVQKMKKGKGKKKLNEKRGKKSSRNLCGTLRNPAEPSRNLCGTLRNLPKGKSLRKPLRNLARGTLRNLRGTLQNLRGTLRNLPSKGNPEENHCGT